LSLSADRFSQPAIVACNSSCRRRVQVGEAKGRTLPDTDLGGERFGAFVTGSLPALLRFGHVLTGNAQEAEDLVQEALVRTLRRQGPVVPHLQQTAPPAAHRRAVPAVVPSTVGLSVQQAVATLRSAIRASHIVIRQAPASLPAGTVVAQSPVAGTRFAPGSQITLTVSAGPSSP
jgi:hypothetical protein